MRGGESEAAQAGVVNVHIPSDAEADFIVRTLSEMPVGDFDETLDDQVEVFGDLRRNLAS